MARRKRRPGKGSPKFPRRRWSPGQAPRVEPPAKGGPYKRPRQKRRGRREADESLDGGP